jgi:hypothetical protein
MVSSPVSINGKILSKYILRTCVKEISGKIPLVQNGA